MMKTLHAVISIFLLSLALQGCVVDKPATRKKATAASKSTANPKAPVFQSDEALYWFSSEKVTGTITLNQNSQNIIYLRGQSVHDFLNGKDAGGEEYHRKQFCLIGNYGASYKQLRVRAVPLSITNFTTKALERVLRIDIPSRNENSAVCSNTTIDGVIPGSAAYSLGEICPSCLGINQLTSNSLSFYESKTSTSSLLAIASTKFNLSSVNIRVDLQSNSNSETSSCTNSSCEAKGFDCCIEGQCVIDASVKTNAQSNYPVEYAQAMNEYAVNPLNFINFPNIFNICSNLSHTPPPVTTPGSTPLSAAEQRVKDYLADYTYMTGVETSGGDTTLCRDSDGLETAYGLVQKKLSIACGCPTTYTCNERLMKCPGWGVRPLYKSGSQTNENIVDFFCYTPPPANPNGPITNLNVNVSGRSAPHRFYSTNGTNYDDIGKISSSILQEGDDFYYLDDLGKTSPVNGSYNVNSILGRMVVGLSQAAPAKMVEVELGKTYILSATSGYFTPCPQCAKDSWFDTFSARPATSGGNGLRAAGYTTSRDTYSGNTTLGNYEDTHFGRACYVPVTMLPFAHKKNIALQTQRLNRLQAQAAMYINGYQRDWFGFNQGALIGSFDGVSWFAVGTGRRVSSTSTKLFLAINSPFLDLASRTDTIVNIIPDSGSNTAADYDYDPELAVNDPKQNAAGSCQQYHQCETDADCITKLGWEYTCADVSQMRTRWPIYDADGKETANQEKTGTIFEILQGTTNIGGSGNRCVYRGAGAPCVRDFTALDGKFNQKVLTCAPNFYCAALSANRFNDEIARSPNALDDILFGLDANILGRPLNYVTAAKSLTAETMSNIAYNGGTEALGLNSVEVADMGICRPGRSLSATPRIAHSNLDTARRSDYISQVGSCDSTAAGSTRFMSCPALGEDMNYLSYNSTQALLFKNMQNSCGGEAKHTTTLISAFKNIEGLSLLNSQNIPLPTLVQDACFRRAGSVCHTDLDCAPNKMHEESVGSISLNYFGGTEAERDYWRESLVCGQGTAIPQFGSADYFKYDLAQNRCCREIGKDFTMYTSGPASLIPENSGSNVNLITKKFASSDPKATFRYSRYSASKTALQSATQTEIPAITAATTPAKNQWKVINETGSRTCCGGGWIRKFSDGTHDWKIKNRLNIDVSNFSCLNFRSPLASPDYSSFSTDNIVQATYQREYESFCKMPKSGGCMQIPYQNTDAFNIYPPLPYDPSAAVANNVLPSITMPALAAGATRLDTSPLSDPTESEIEQSRSVDVPYQPFAYYFSPFPYDFYFPNKSSYNFFIDKATDYGASMYLPAYIPFDGTNAAIDKIYVRYFYKNGSNYTSEIVNITALKASKVNCDNVAAYSGGTPGGMPVDEIANPTGAGADFEAWCVSANARTQNRPVLHVKAYTGANPAKQWIYASVVVDFKPLEITKGLAVSVPGNPYYYLTKLGHLELIGIPQITYEPLYCNNDQSKLVPGIFTSSLVTRANLVASTESHVYAAAYDSLRLYDEDGTATDNVAGYGNSERRFTYQNMLGHSAIFSAKDFTCCTPLGKETTSAAKCCAGSAKTVGGKMYCNLPSGTDLHVYFNKFVSSEGVGEEWPGGGLIVDGTEAEVDFISYTGEPKMRSSTYQKLEELGRAFCQNGIVTNGGAFGKFPSEPFSGSYVDGELDFGLSIVDSIIDSVSGEPNVGKFPFDAGYRWDHHYYCK